MTQTTLFFDLDGTLIVNPFWSVVFPTVSQSLADQTGRSAEDMFNLIMGEHDRRIANPLADRQKTMDWEDIIQSTAASVGASYDGTAEALVVAHAAPPYTATLDHAEEVLPLLQSNGTRQLVVATMGLSKYQVPVLHGLRIHDFFSEVLAPDLTGYLKTEREFYKQYPDEPTLRIHVGDRYDHDCYFPKQFGSRAVLRLPIEALHRYDPFERPYHLDEVADYIGGKLSAFDPLPDAVVVHLEELPSVIEEIERGIA